MIIKDRHAKLLELLPKHKYKVAPAAIEAGFTQQTAYKAGKSLLKNAMKRQLKNELGVLEGTKMPELGEMKQTLASRLGMTSEDVLNVFKSILLQDKDIGTKLKALVPVLRDEGIEITQEQEQTKVPVLNVVVKERSTEPQNNPIPTQLE